MFSSTGTPVSSPNLTSSAWNRASSSAVTVCTRAEPSTWVTAGRCASGSTATVSSMNGEGTSRSKYRSACSAATAGAKGRNSSRFFTSMLIWSRMAPSRGSPRIERLPRARGPNSIRPWYQPITLPWVSRVAVAVSSSDSRPV